MRRNQLSWSARARLQAGFTLLEVILAMGILAVGATASLALLVSATSTGRRGEHYVNTALIADSVFADIEADLHDGFTLDGLEVADGTPDRSPSLVDGPIRAVPFMNPKAQAVGAGPKQAGPKKKPAPPAPPPKAPPSGNAPAPAASNGAPRAYAEDPFAGVKTFWLKKDQTPPAYPDYKYNVAITPIGGPPDEPWEFLVEVVVRWSESGKRRSETYQTVLLKRLRQLDNPAPPDPQR